MPGPRYFVRTPKAGHPISLRGLADGLAKIENALRNMRCEGGSVVHSDHGVPTILPFGEDQMQSVVDFLASLSSMINPDYVLGKKVDPETDEVTYGWVPTVSHASQHQAMEEEE